LNWGLGIGDWGLGIGPNPQSPIPNPQSPFLIKQNKNFDYLIIKFSIIKLLLLFLCLFIEIILI